MPECTPGVLLELAKCFVGLSIPQLEAIKAYLLAISAGVEPDLSDLMDGSKCFQGLSEPQLKAIQTYLLCQIANATPAPPGETDGLIWGPTPETVDSIAGDSDDWFTFLTTVFPLSTYTTLSFGNPTHITSDLEFDNGTVATSVEFRLLETVGGGIFIDANTQLTAVLLPLLTTVGGAISLSSNTLLTVVNLPSLVSCASIAVNFGVVETLSAPVMTSYPPSGIAADASLLTLNLPACVDDGAGQLNTDLSVMTGLVTLNLAAIVTITANLTLSGSPNLASFTASAWVPTDGTTIDFNGCSLDIPSVENILRRCVLAGVTTCTIDLSGGTNAGTASLSAQGQADVATLGAQVTMNP